MLPRMTRRPAAALSGGCGTDQALGAHGVDRPAEAIAQRHGRLRAGRGAARSRVVSKWSARMARSPAGEVSRRGENRGMPAAPGPARSSCAVRRHAASALHPQINGRARSSFQLHMKTKQAILWVPIEVIARGDAGEIPLAAAGMVA
jgi:hypothetical protein